MSDESWMATISLTSGERLWTWRKRLRLSVSGAAEKLQTSRFAYVEAEHDRAPLPSTFKGITPTSGELLRVLRRRSNVARDDVAARLGVSHVTYLKLERKSDERVVRLWVDADLTLTQLTEVVTEP